MYLAQREVVLGLGDLDLGDAGEVLGLSELGLRDVSLGSSDLHLGTVFSLQNADGETCSTGEISVMRDFDGGLVQLSGVEVLGLDWSSKSLLG